MRPLGKPKGLEGPASDDITLLHCFGMGAERRNLAAGIAVQIAATHHHAFSRDCEGTFVLTRQSASYRSPREDAPGHRFDVPLEAVARASHDLITGALALRAPTAEQVEKGRDKAKNWTLSLDRPAAYDVAKILARYISGT